MGKYYLRDLQEGGKKNLKVILEKNYFNLDKLKQKGIPLKHISKWKILRVISKRKSILRKSTKINKNKRNKKKKKKKESSFIYLLVENKL